MTIKEIREFAITKGFILPKREKKAVLVRLIQYAEGNNACYAMQKCENNMCLWYKDCQKDYTKQVKNTCDNTKSCPKYLLNMQK